MWKKIAVSLALIPIFLSGCGLFELEKTVVDNTNTVVVNSDLQDKIVDSLKNASRSECVDLYKFFAGFALYLEKSTQIKSTSEIDGLFAKVQAEYGWQREKYRKLSDIIGEDLKDKFGVRPKDIDEVRDELIKTYNEYAEACKVAANSK